jgi:TolB-like protein/Tfp pilus assembly protein PilF
VKSPAGQSSRLTEEAGPTQPAGAEALSGTASGFGAAPLDRGIALGRYVLQELVAGGGMGVVYLAHDPELNRKIALKLLRPGAWGNLSRGEAQSRLMREAQAMARLSHPNVIAVHDVGTCDDQVFIAMEYISGRTLSQWLAQNQHSYRDVLAVFIQAGRGLAAAHVAGMVHRDFKPDNVLVGDTGQVKVLDFGLARAVEGAAEETHAQSLEWSTPGRLGEQLTRTGAFLGTPNYMAPEQLKRGPTDARSDQFSYCVALHEALYAERPFAGDSVEALLAEEVAGNVRESPNPLRVPNRIRRILLRGLSPDPKNRYPSMEPLIEAFVDAGKPRAPRVLWNSAVAAMVVLALLLGTGLGGWRDRLLRRIGPLKIQSIAVLPLENLTGDPSQQYFADGMTDALTTNLAQISSLRVISRAALTRYKGKALSEIARSLNVDAVVEGSVLRSGTRVRINGQLVNAATNHHLWAKSYERELTDVVALQSEVAEAIAKEIRVQVSPDEQARLASVAPVNPEVYDNYLKGHFHNLRENKVDNELAIALLERAVTLDPTFARAHAELARAYTIRMFYFAPEEKQWEEKAFVAIEKAIALDPNLADAHWARGYLLWTHSNHFAHEQAIQAFRRALAINSNLDEAHHYIGLVYLHIGLFQKAMDEAQKALTLNPTNTNARYRVGVILHLEGQYEQALMTLQTIPKEFNPALVGRQTAWTLFSLGKKEEAAALIDKSLKSNPKDEGGQFTGMQAMLLASAGEPVKAEEKIKLAIEQGKGFSHFHHTAYNVACAYALMNKPELALRWLREAAADGYPCYPLFEKDASLNNLRSDPRFIQFMADLKKQWEYYKATL